MPESRQASLAIAWAGTLVFAGSLLWFFYCYASRFDRLGPGPLTTAGALRAAAIDVALFTLFAAHHSLLARSRAKAWIQQRLPADLERSAYVWIASLLFVAVCTWWQPLAGTLYTLDGAARPVGWAVQLAGVAITIRTSRMLDVLDLSGVRQAQGGRSPSRVPLKVTGLYGLVRHPLYFGWALMVFGAPDMTSTRALFAVVSTGYLALAIPWEERSLLQTFGREYADYQRDVRWRLLPWIY
jgi:protein-S-isoprenylcysteine O-methyltransferase Ste14